MAELTVYTSSSDGYLWEDSNVSFQDVHDFAIANVLSGQTRIIIGTEHKSVPNWYIYRGFLFFDTSALPDGAVISAVILSIYPYQHTVTGGDFDLIVQNGQPTYPHDSLVSGDFLYSHYSSDGGSINSSTFTDDTYNDITLNATGRGWINKTGTTKLCLRSSKDIDVIDIAEDTISDVYFYALETGSAYRAKLVITYSMTPSTVTTQAVSDIKVTTLTGNGNITSIGSDNCTRRGFCYMEGSSGDPTTANDVVYDDGSFGTGAYEKSITGLTKDSHYRVRAYAINSGGTSYGSTVQTTTDKMGVSTQAISAIGEITATGNGNITDTGGENATKRGVCWKTSSGPDVNDSKSEEIGNFGTGEFTRPMTGLARGEEYHVKAYAYNSGGYSYGSEVTFYTYPAVTTQAPTDILRADPTTVTANGLIELDEVEDITTRGFKYGKTETDTWTKSESGSYSEGTFSLVITIGLEADTTFYIRAYAIGAWGTKYGSYLEFKTAYPYGANKVEIKSEATASASDIAAVGGKRSLTIENHLIQTQTVADLISAAYLADYKDQKTKLVVTKPTPAPYQIGDTIERSGALLPYYAAVSALISYAPAASAVHHYGLAGRDMIIRKLNVSFSAGNYISVIELED